MSATASFTYPYYLQQVSIYVGIPLLATGVVGNLLVVIVFLSLTTFRENSCAFYLLIMSFVNIGQLVTGLLSRVMINGFSIDWPSNSPFYCKFRQYGLQVCVLISITCLCLATMDQYFATSPRFRWQQWSNIKVARRLSSITVVIWLLHGIPLFFYFNLIPSPKNNNTTTCSLTNDMYSKYFSYGYTAVFTGYLPVFFTILFGSLAYWNVRNITYRVVPFIRRELHKQLTVMVLTLIFFDIIALMPYPVILVLTSVTTITRDPQVAAQVNFASSLTSYFYYLYFAVSSESTLFSDLSHSFVANSVRSMSMSVLRNGFVGN